MKIVDVDVYTVDPAKHSTPNSVEYPDIWTVTAHLRLQAARVAA
jgi:hypothetical protein